MRCLYPRTVGFRADGRTLSWSLKNRSKEYPEFQLPCGRCIECRLQYGAEWALRSVKEAMMYDQNCFITLTYSDENLGNNKLNYIEDFQPFINRLRSKIFNDFMKKNFGEGYWSSLDPKQQKEFRKEHKNEIEKTRISVFSTGEYGEKGKRKHWHALIFNWRPSDLLFKFSTSRGDKNYSSASLDLLWGKGDTITGDITLESAGYCARYAAKKLCHGRDGEHEYVPVSKKSCKNAIGKAWLEKYWKTVFELGYVEHEGTKHSIPRYFEKWFKKNKIELYVEFLVRVKSAKAKLAIERAEKLDKEYKEQLRQKELQCKNGWTRQLDHKDQKIKISEIKFKRLQEWLKL